MSTLKSILDELHNELLDEQEPIEDLDNIGMEIQAQLNLGKLTDFTSEELLELSPTQREFYNALVYCQTVWEFYTEIAFDGLLSIFYNETGKQIEELRTILQDNNNPIIYLFNEAYSLVSTLFEIQPNKNWVMRHLDKNPYEALSDDIINRIESIENQINDMQDQVDILTFEKALNAAKQIS